MHLIRALLRHALGLSEVETRLATIEARLASLESAVTAMAFFDRETKPELGLHPTLPAFGPYMETPLVQFDQPVIWNTWSCGSCGAKVQLGDDHICFS